MIKIYDGNNSKIDIEDIIADIDLQTSLQELEKEELLQYLEENLEKMKKTAILQAFSDHRFQTVKWDWHGFLKKIIRKLTGWYIQKIEQQQTSFNQYVMQSITVQQRLLEQLYEEQKGYHTKEQSKKNRNANARRE